MLLLEDLTKSGEKTDVALRLDSEHHRWLWRILHVSRRDKIKNKSVRERTGQEDMENIIRNRRLRG